MSEDIKATGVPDNIIPFKKRETVSKVTGKSLTVQETVKRHMSGFSYKNEYRLQDDEDVLVIVLAPPLENIPYPIKQPLLVIEDVGKDD